MAGFIAYYRVSTARQGQSGLGLEAQRASVAAHVASKSAGLLLGEFQEVESGRKNDRPQLAAALALCKRRKATLVIAKLDRLARNVRFISALMESDVQFQAVDMPEANDLMVHVMAAFAQHERRMISERTRAALAAKKARGERLGNPRPDLLKARASASLRASLFHDTTRPLAHSLAAGGASLRAVAAELNARSIPTLNGGSWHAATVGRLLATS